MIPHLQSGDGEAGAQIAAIDDSKKSTVVTILAAGDVYQQSASAELIVIPPSTAAPLGVNVEPQTGVGISTNHAGDLLLDPKSKPITVTLGENQSTSIELGKGGAAEVKVGADEKPAVTANGQLQIRTGKSKDMLEGADTTKVQINSDPGANVRITSGDGGPTIRASGPPTSNVSSVLLFSSQTTIGSDNRTISFTFPSLAASNLAAKDKSPELKLRVHFFRTNGEEFHPDYDHNGRDLRYVLAKPAGLAIQLTINAKVILARPNGRGEVQAVITGLDPKVSTTKNYLTVAGADIVSASQVDPITKGVQLITISTDKKAAGKIPITANGIITMQLANLHPTSNVSISAEDENGVKADAPASALVVVTEAEVHNVLTPK
jgi:hypothetical protein